jgi:hypothetical protein
LDPLIGAPWVLGDALQLDAGHLQLVEEGVAKPWIGLEFRLLQGPGQQEGAVGKGAQAAACSRLQAAQAVGQKPEVVAF